MKLLFVVASLFAAVHAQIFSIVSPAPGTTLVPGQTLTVEIEDPVHSSIEASQVELSLVIGIVACGTSPCPPPSADLGELLFTGIITLQGFSGTTFQNFTITVPTDITGAASIQAQHAYFIRITAATTHAIPHVDYTSVAITIGSGSTSGSSLNIHPNGDNTKCVGILGGAYANGSPVDIFDCNQSVTQKWQWNGNSLVSINPTDGSQWCLDSGVQSTWANGLKMKIWQCLANVPQQTWTPDTSSGTIKLTTANFCLDLTNGIKTNQNVLQIWTCSAGNANQIWTVTPA